MPTDRHRVRGDVDELEELFEQRSAGGRLREARSLEGALALFRAEPLAGCDYAWSDGQVRSQLTTACSRPHSDSSIPSSSGL